MATPAKYDVRRSRLPTRPPVPATGGGGWRRGGLDYCWSLTFLAMLLKTFSLASDVACCDTHIWHSTAAAEPAWADATMALPEPWRMDGFWSVCAPPS